MAGAGKKWLMGCGIGCGMIVLILGGIGTCGYMGVKKLKDRADQIEDSFEALSAEYGRPGEFVPDVDGRIPAARMEAFITVREAMRAQRDETSLLLRIIDDETEESSAASTIEKIKAGVTFLPKLMLFLEERNDMLRTEGMGLGEYLYIYGLAHYNVLGLDPADGPGIQIRDDAGGSESGIQIGHSSGSDDPEERRDERNRIVRKYLHRIQSEIAGNQLRALDLTGSVGDEAWAEALSAEIDLMESESRRLLWEDALPDRLRDSITPYRDQLLELYDPTMNAIEVGLIDED